MEHSWYFRYVQIEALLFFRRRCIHIEINVVYLGRATAILYAEVMTILIENEKCHQ